MPIYQEILGDDFKRLHPMLQERYTIEEGFPFRGKGTMKVIDGGPKWLYPLFLAGIRRKLLFPEHGRNIPFTITNKFLIGRNKERQVHWERVFHFPNKKRFFNALMSKDENGSVIKDYLGEPALVYASLVFTVTPEGGLQIASRDQRFILGKLEIPLPYFLQGLATVIEEYDEQRGVYVINVKVRNPIIGRVFSYTGEFVRDA